MSSMRSKSLVKSVRLAPTQSRRFECVTADKAAGVTYTPKTLARFVADQIALVATVPCNKPVRIVDPAVGDGGLLLSLVDALHEKGVANLVVHGFDTDGNALTKAASRLKAKYPDIPIDLREADFLSYALAQKLATSGLFQSEAAEKFDLLIANPPYVRTQILGTEQAQLLGRYFGLTGRVDLYYAFLLAMASVLKPTGTSGVIVSNRFMTTQSGGSVRKAILESLDVEHIWDLGDTKLFDAAVLPAVILSHGRKCRSQPAMTRFTSIYECDDPPTSVSSNQLDALALAGVVRISDGRRFNVRQGRLDSRGSPDSIWRISTDSLDTWLATVEAHSWGTFGSIGKIRVGIKTCADSVFIRDDWHNLPETSRPELLRPLLTHHGARRFRARTLLKQKQVVYPHEVRERGRAAVDLEKYPITAKYLLAHRRALEERRYVIEGGRQWYEIWVPQDPAAWILPKLVFRDISEQPCFWLNLDGSVVNGDCYWLAPEKSTDEPMLWLAAAVGNSTFAEAFYDHRFNNKLYAGRRRFMTQYVEQFPLPDPALEISRKIVCLARQAYEEINEPESESIQLTINSLVWEAFGLPLKEVVR